MNNKQEKIKEILLPYILGERKFGYDKKNNKCKYYQLEDDGNVVTCAAGFCMVNPEIYHSNLPISSILVHRGGEKEVMKPEYTDIFSSREWGAIQGIHDNLAKNQNNSGLWNVFIRLWFSYDINTL